MCEYNKLFSQGYLHIKCQLSMSMAIGVNLDMEIKKLLVYSCSVVCFNKISIRIYGVFR